MFRQFDNVDDFWRNLGQFDTLFGPHFLHPKLQKFWSKHRELVKPAQPKLFKNSLGSDLI